MTLTVRALSFERQNGFVLHNINFTIQHGQILHLHGKNGAGKTTLLKLLAGVLYPSTGQIHFNDQSIYQDLATYQQAICYVGHKHGVNHLLTVRENCQFNLQITNQSLLDGYLSQFNLLELASTQCASLSTGQIKRLNLVKLASSAASLWLLDEPFASLDQETATSFITKQACNHGLVIISSHQALPITSWMIQELQL